MQHFNEKEKKQGQGHDASPVLLFMANGMSLRDSFQMIPSCSLRCFNIVLHTPFKPTDLFGEQEKHEVFRKYWNCNSHVLRGNTNTVETIGVQNHH